jgi:hypothetical protein
VPAISVNVPAAQVPRVEAAFRATYGYPTQILDGEGNTVPNPETPQQFVQRMLREHVRDVVVRHEMEQTEAERIEGELGIS